MFGATSATRCSCTNTLPEYSAFRAKNHGFRATNTTFLARTYFGHSVFATRKCRSWFAPDFAPDKKHERRMKFPFGSRTRTRSEVSEQKNARQMQGIFMKCSRFLRCGIRCRIGGPPDAGLLPCVQGGSEHAAWDFRFRVVYIFWVRLHRVQV